MNLPQAVREKMNNVGIKREKADIEFSRCDIIRGFLTPSTIYWNISRAKRKAFLKLFQKILHKCFKTLLVVANGALANMVFLSQLPITLIFSAGNICVVQVNRPRLP